MKKSILIILLGVSLFIVGCTTQTPGEKQNENMNRKEVLIRLYELFKNGSISECRYDGNTYYSAGLNAYDAGNNIYNNVGNPIAGCNYAWGKVDPLCTKLTNCENIYRVKNNIWGQPAVDKYELGD